MDVLTDALEAIHVKSLVSGRLELSAPWGLIGEPKQPGFVVVTRGTCWIQLEDAEPIQLGGGDFVLMPQMRSYSLRDERSSPVTPIAQLLANCPPRKNCQPGGVFVFGGGGAETTLVGGKFHFDDGDRNPLLRSLPPIIHIRGDKGTPVPWLDASLQFIAMEMASGQPGAETIVGRLADILFVQAIRAHIATAGWR